MRWIAIISFLLWCDCLCGQIVAFVSDTSKVYLSVWDDSTYYLKNVSPDSSWIIYFDAAKTKVASSKKYISKDRYDFKTWYANGQPKRFQLNNDSIPYYDKDVISWFSDGHLERQIKTTRDSTIAYSWWPNHVPQTVRKFWGTPWKHNYGHTLFWHASGLLCEEMWVYPDSTRMHNYHDNGAISWIRIFLRDAAKRESFCYSDEVFHPNGQVSRSIVYPAKGRQPCTYFYESGIKRAECDWMQGNIGPYTEWHENGKLKSEGHFIMGIKKFTHVTTINYYPTKSGHWVYYNQAGWKEREEWYELDGTVTFKHFNEKGDVINSGTRQEEIPAGVIFPKEYQQ